jgi:hypothetical protein
MAATIGKVTISDTGGITIKGLVGSKTFTSNQIEHIDYLSGGRGFFWNLIGLRFLGLVKIFSGKTLVILKIKRTEKAKCPRFWLSKEELNEFKNNI